ncbi:MAG: DinB family protein [Phycisphaerales bacterium]
MHALITPYVAGAGALHHAVQGLTHAELVAPPAGPGMGAWSIKQVVVHMWHSDLAATHRMCRMAVEDKPLLIAYDETAFADGLSYHEVDTQTVCELFRLNRLHTASMLERLPAAAFERTGVHNQRGLVTLRDMLKIYVDHVDHHMAFIAKKRAAIGK